VGETLKIVKEWSSDLLWLARRRVALSRANAACVMDKLGCEVSVGSIQNWETGKTIPDAHYLPWLAATYKVKMEAFYE